MQDAYNDTTNDTTRPSPNPFMVPGPVRADPKSTIDTHHDPTPTRDAETRPVGSMNHNPFVWVVPSGATGNESPAVKTLVSGDGDNKPTRRTDHNDRASDDHNNNDALDRTRWSVGQDPTMRADSPKTEGATQSNPLINPNPNHGYVRLLDDRDDEDDDRTSRTGHSEDESVTLDETLCPAGWVDDGGHVTGDDDDLGGSTETHGGDGDRLLARHNVTVSDDGGNRVDSTRLREGVQIGTVKRELLDYRPRSKRRAPRQQSRIPFSPQIPKILDFLTRWRIGTTAQLARVAGWTDSNENRVLKKLRSYDEVGFIRETNLYAGPKIWTATEHGAERGFHPWLGGVKASEINPMSQSHTFGLSSIASWLLCPWETTPNILGLAPDEWLQVRGEIKAGTAYVLSEKEYRSAYASLRTTRAGLLPAEYRHGFIGGPGGHENPITGAWREWARSYKNGDSTLADSPELLACDPEFMGAGLWMWIIWGNSVWNPKVLEDRAAGEVDVDDLSWAGRDGELRLRSEFRRYGLIPIEERVDIVSNKPIIHRELGDRFALWDHLPDLIIARRRTDDGYADPQSIAIELELSAKTPEAYARTMAAYGSPLGKTLYRKVIWLVPSKTIADKIRAGARQVGMVLGEDYEIVPFVTSNEASVIKRSFYSGADILPGRWNQRGTIELTMDGRSIPLS